MPDFNDERPYTPEFWADLQQIVGANPDGLPGAKTSAAISAFQGFRSLNPDGKAGRITTTACTLMMEASCALFIGALSIDADGAPEAYNPENTGIDHYGNGGWAGSVPASIEKYGANYGWGLSLDKEGEPYVQGACNPFPGYFISSTALIDGTKPKSDPARYVDSVAIPYFALPGNWRKSSRPSIPVGLSRSDMRKGDVGLVLRLDDLQRRSFAIYADVGPHKAYADRLGEGSIALAEALGHDPFNHGNPNRANVGSSDEYVYLCFPGSGHGRPLTIEEINRRGAIAYESWGGEERLAFMFTTM